METYLGCCEWACSFSGEMASYARCGIPCTQYAPANGWKWNCLAVSDPRLNDSRKWGYVSVVPTKVVDDKMKNNGGVSSRETCRLLGTSQTDIAWLMPKKSTAMNLKEIHEIGTIHEANLGKAKLMMFKMLFALPTSCSQQSD